MGVKTARSLIVIAAVSVYCLLLLLIFATPASHITAVPEILTPSLLLLTIALAVVCVSDGPLLTVLFLFLFSTIPICAALRFKHLPYLYHVIFLFTAAGLIYFFKTLVNREGSKIEVEIQHITEERNFLLEEYKKRQTQLESLRKKYKRYMKLKDFAEQLSGSLSLEEVAALIVTWSYHVAEKAETALLFLVDEEKQELALFYSKGKTGHPRVKTKKGDIFDHWVLKQRQPLIVRDAGKDFRFSLQKAEEETHVSRSIISAPLLIKQRVLGVIRLDSPVADLYTPDDLRLLGIMAHISAVALANAFLYKKTLELATEDGLTGLYLNRHFKERLSEEMARAVRENTPCSLLMIDIDDFKVYNDTYGHSAGDIVLREIAEILATTYPEDAICARYGGEEFTVILPGYNKAQARDAAQKVCDQVAAHKIHLRREETSVTVSIGLVAFPDDAISPEELTKLADKAMYSAKQKGKNQVWSS
ncbi:MAG: sensor domain-containing diguanylate cyclase [Candidatus Omnitrophica bacterium]|nr:sensor domain-containing diguanylate cyclase [Candidatus Omnitrophota bacterium]